MAKRSRTSPSGSSPPTSPEGGGSGPVAPGEVRPQDGRRLGVAGRLRAYFFAGILITAPISITFYLAWLFISFVDARVTPLIPARFNPETYLPFALPGLGLVVVLVGLTVIGMLTAGFVGKLVMRFYEGLLARMPIVRSIYGAIKQITETVLAHQSTAFRQAVLIEYPRRGVWAIGFLTGVTRGEVQTLTEHEVLNVFLPTTPNPTSGFLLFIPREDVLFLKMSVEEALKMVVSGGIVTPPEPVVSHRGVVEADAGRALTGTDVSGATSEERRRTPSDPAPTRDATRP